MNIEISKDVGYWGEAPTQADLAELKRIVLAIDPKADIEIVEGDEHNTDEAQAILDKAWEVFCNT